MRIIPLSGDAGEIVPSKHRSWLDSAALFTLFTLPVVNVIGPLSNYVSGIPLIQISQLFLAFFGLLLAAREGARSYKISFISIAVFVWMVLGLLFGFMNLSRSVGANDILQFSLNIAMVLLIPAYKHLPGPLRALKRGWLSAFWIVAVAGFVNVTTGFSFQNSLESQSLKEDLGISAVFHNPNTFGLFLVITFPIFISGAMGRSSSPLKRFYYTLGAIVAANFVLATRSELCLAAILSQLIVIPFLINKTRRLRPLTGFAFWALIMAAFWQYFVKQDAPGNDILLSYPRLAAVGSWQDGELNTIQARIELWNAGMQIIKDQHVIGSGPHSFSHVISTRGFTLNTGGASDPHNGYLEVAVEYGVIVAVLLLASLIALIIKIALAYPQLDDFRRHYAVVIILQVVGVSIATFAPGSTLQSIFVWAWLATIVLFMSTLYTKSEQRVSSMV